MYVTYRATVSELSWQKSLRENHGHVGMSLARSPCSSCLPEAGGLSARARFSLSSSPEQRIASSVAVTQEKSWEEELF